MVRWLDRYIDNTVDQVINLITLVYISDSDINLVYTFNIFNVKNVRCVGRIFILKCKLFEIAITNLSQIYFCIS